MCNLVGRFDSANMVWRYDREKMVPCASSFQEIFPTSDIKTMRCCLTKSGENSTCKVKEQILPFQQLNKRHLRRSKSLVSLLLWGENEDDDFGKAKNIRQTELLVDLREAILQVARHFQSLDPKNSRVVSLISVLYSY